MNDIFAQQDTPVGGDESTQSGEPSGGSIIPPMEQTDSAAIPPLEQSTDPGIAMVPGQDQADGDGTGQASSDAQAGTQPTEADLQKLEQEAEAVLADERTPKWYKNVVQNVYKPKIAEALKKVEAYEPFGAPEDVSKAVQMRTALSEVRSDPNTGMPVRTTENFVKTLFEEDPGVAYQLMNDLAQLPSPITQGLTVTQELLRQVGIDPNRLPDIQKFAENGYSLTASSFAAPDPMDLSQISEKYHSTFAKLDPDTRESLMSDTEAVRNNNLEAHRIRLQQEEANSMTEEQRTAQSQQEESQKQAQFKAAVDAKGTENYTKTAESIMNTFADSLTKQAGLSKFDSMMVVNTVVNALEPTLAGKMSLEALKAEGIEIDAQAPGIINRLQELSNHAAYYQLVGDTQSLQNVVADISDLQEKLIAKSNKVIAALAAKRNGGQQGQPLPTQNTSRHAIAGAASMNGVPGVTRPRMDFSEEGYMDDIKNDPFFKK